MKIFLLGLSYIAFAACPEGQIFDTTEELCHTDQNVYGPFSDSQKRRCVEYGGGDATCKSSNVWNIKVLGIQPGTPKAITLNVPYFYQYNNQYEPGRTCNVTSLAMVLSYYGKKVTPDEIYQSVGGPVFTGPDVVNIAKGYKFNATYSEKGSADIIKKYLNRGIPVILQGWFTQSGHFMVIIGYNDKEKSWVVNDPAGQWDGCYQCGYSDGNSSNGNNGRYSYLAMAEAATDNDPNTYWITTVTP